MSYKVKLYAQFSLAVGFFDEFTSREVKSRDLIPVEDLPNATVCYRFYEELTADVEMPWGETKKESSRENYSGWIYPDGKLMTLEDVQRDMPEEKILISNMKCNGWDPIVQHRFGGCRPLEKGDRVV